MNTVLQWYVPKYTPTTTALLTLSSNTNIQNVLERKLMWFKPHYNKTWSSEECIWKPRASSDLNIIFSFSQCSGTSPINVFKQFQIIGIDGAISNNKKTRNERKNMINLRGEKRWASYLQRQVKENMHQLVKSVTHQNKVMFSLQKR